MKRRLALCCLLLVATAGCLGPAASEATPTTEERTQTVTAPTEYNDSRAKQIALARAERAALDSVDEPEYTSGIGGGGGSGTVTATITGTNETGVSVRTSVPYYVSGPDLAGDFVHRETVFVSFEDLETVGSPTD